MTKSVFFYITLFSVFITNLSFGQHTADSLHTLLKTADSKQSASINLQLANHFLATEPDSTLYYGRLAQEIGTQTNDPTAVIRSYAMIAEAYQKQNKMKEALSSYLKGLGLAEKHHATSLSGTIYNGIGTCYFYLNDITKAKQYFKLAVQAKKEANDYQYYAFISANLSALQIMEQSFSEAVKTLKDAEKTLLKNKQSKYLPTIYNSLGAAYQGIQPDSCLYFYGKAHQMAAANKDYLNMMATSQNIGDYYLSQKNYAKAIAYTQQAIATNDQRPEDQFKPALFQRMSALYDSIGDFKNAYVYKKLETEIRQKLLSEAKQKQIEELEIKYQSEKKEQAIEKAKNQRNMLLFGAVFIFVIAGFTFYLILQRKKLERKSEQEKIKMFENILHDIRTPLTLIDGPIQLMKQNPGSSHQDQLLLMERNSKKLTQLVNELLDASRLGRGNFELAYISGDVNHFITDIIDSFEAEAKAKGISIVNVQNQAANFCAFPSNALEKILNNLISNAVKHCPNGSDITVTTEIADHQLVVQVGDTGPGIPKKEQKKVFRRFFRGKNAAENGTGIGLALVSELVALANGKIALHSGAAGTLFTVSIPLPGPSASGQTVSNSQPTLLLVEDNSDMAAFTIEILKENFQIIHAKNGLEAMGLIREELPEIVLSDVMMPEKDGIELLREIRSDELTNHLPVVLFSAKASLESRLTGLQHGADAYISKPFSPKELKLTVQNLFATMQRNRQSYQDSVHSYKTFEERIKSENAYVNKVIGKIIDNIGNNAYTVSILSDDMAVSRSQLHRKLVSLTGYSTANFISMIRLEKAKDLLIKNEGNVTEIAYQCGFNSQSYFTKSFTEYFQKTPSQFVKDQQ